MEALFLKIRGALIAAVVITILALMQNLGLLAPNPVLIGIVVVVYAAFVGGVWDGITSALFILIYVSYLVVSGASLGVDLIFLFLAIPAVAIMVSILKYRLESYARRLEEIDRTKTEFIALAAHQLRTPLTTVKWYTEILLGEGESLTDEQRQSLQAMAESNERMVELVNALLNVSRIELGATRVEQETCSLTGIADQILSELRPEIEAKHLAITRHYERGSGEVRSDRKLLQMILDNLVSNAVKYTPPQGNITVVLEKNPDSISMTVSDTGYGIPTSEQERVFTKLFRAQNIRKRDTTGTGLGLYLVKLIVDKLGGSISFESVENQGTTFRVLLPL